MSSGEPVKLLGSFGSPFTKQAEAALRLKGDVEEDEFIEEDVGNKTALLLASNPVHKKVPLLLHGGRAVAESLVIVEYVDQAFPEPPLVPADPLASAEARFWAQAEETRANLALLEARLQGWRFFGGEAVGDPDLATSALAAWLPVLEELAGVGAEGTLMGEEEFPALCQSAQWRSEYTSDEAVRACLPSRSSSSPTMPPRRTASSSEASRCRSNESS
uniref:Glutathione S-transferase n=1 Tax=Aegilops tauschii TaxID=37682 RepID=M8C6W2_AEGTA